MNRRTFLAQTAALPAIFGLRNVLGQDPPSTPPSWYRAALRRMKETHRNGLVLVIPEPERDDFVSEEVPGSGGIHLQRVTEEAARQRLGLTLWILANESHPGAHLLFAEVILICMTAGEADRWVRPSGDSRNRFLLDPTGSVIASDLVPAVILDDPESFVSSFTSFVHGPGNDRLRERAQGIGKTLKDDVKNALAALNAEGPEEREAAAAILLREAETLAPYFAHEAVAGRDAETRGRMRDLLARYYAAAREDAAGPRLPYGTYLPEFVDSCGQLTLKQDVIIECGLGRAPSRSRKFIRFLTP